MPDFQKKSFSQFDIPKDDEGVSVSKVLSLVHTHPFYEDLSDMLGVKNIENEFIAIPGARTLLQAMEGQNKKFKKFDLEATYDELEFSFDKNPPKNFQITFNSVQNEKHISIIGGNSFTAEPIYSARSDFFESNFKMDKYANYLMGHGLSEMVSTNLDMIRQVYSKHKAPIRRYRILKDNQGRFYLRGIVSPMYNDYSNNITVFLGLILLHFEMKKTPARFLVSRCEFNESFVRVFFEKKGSSIIPGIGKMNYLIELSNDEIKRESMRFSGVCSITVTDKNLADKQIYLKPRDFKSSLTAIRHNLTPKKAFENLASFAEYGGNEKEMLNDALTISAITRPDQIRHLVETKVENSKQNELKKYNKQILDELNRRVSTVHELLLLLNKLDLIVEDIDAKEYLRYLMYEVLIPKKRKPEE